MGVFDLFGREPRMRNGFNDEKTKNDEAAKGPVSVFSPTSFTDVENIIASIKSGKTVIVHLTELKAETAVRVLDMLSGAIFALDGGVYEMEKNIFMFSPTGVEIN